MKHNLIERVLVGILLVIAALIVVHAPLTVWLGTVWPDQVNYIKAWKEVLMGVALVLLIVTAARRKKVDELLGDRVMQLSLVFAGLHLLLVGLFQNSLQQAGAGLLIDLRFVLYFVLVYGTLRLLPRYRKLFAWVFAAGAVVVLGFALLQQFVLPRDILANIGYSKSTITPYLLVDENQTYVRLNSTLRGPNPLGAYAVIVITILAAFALKSRMKPRDWVLIGVGAAAAGLALGVSYSRSSLIGAAVALLTVLVVAVTGRARRRVWLALGALTIVIAGGLFALRDTSFVANVVLHDNPTTGAAVDSNAGHASSLLNGLRAVVSEPLGYGVGSTGSASLGSDSPLIIENQYLFVAHEAGWIGLALFAWLFVEIMRRLWSRRQDIIALGVFASGVGLAVIGLFLPVWVDDTVSIVWWGLAGLAISYGFAGQHIEHEKTKSKGRKRHA